jgi:hypothetical protein
MDEFGKERERKKIIHQQGKIYAKTAKKKRRMRTSNGQALNQ